MIRPELARRADALTAERVPFVTATVVRAQRPTSVRPGDTALVLGDGTIEGFVGGACGESAVRMHSLRALETGEALLLRIVPGDEESAPQEGAVTVSNPCLSGGALEIFLEPRLPAPRIAVVGDTPIALALSDLGERLGYDVSLSAVADADLHEAEAVVVASHGRDEERTLACAVRAGVHYIGLVASRRRGQSVLDELRATGLPEEHVARVRTPAGLDIGARSAEEIALSILAEIVATRERAAVPPGQAASSPDGAAMKGETATAIDPVCGMEVAAVVTSPQAEYEGTVFYFCCEGCRGAFLEDPARHAAAR